ncbi:MAG: Do family serine endopeptidase [Moraxellaceae bacterium]|nr:Do family serine endopeptidase [Moraxellaceae bacterium]
MIPHSLLRCLVGALCSFCFLSFALARELPDFASLVERQGAVVVNITANRATSAAAATPLQQEDMGSVPEWWRRFAPRQPDQAPEDEDESVGSGLIVGADGYIITNAHVVAGADEILVRLQDKREFAARLIGSDRRTDIALLRIEANGLPRAVLGDPSKLRVGDWVLAIGSPFGFDNSVTAGIVSAKGRSFPDDSLVPFIQTDVAVNPGNSGGPLFNLRGEVIGINSQIYSRTGGFMGLSFSIPIDVAMDVQAQLRERGKVRRGRIGVLIQEVTRDISDSFDLDRPRGALVGAVEPGSPADQAGIKVSDIILRFDGKPVETSSELPRIVGATQPGKKASLQVWRQRGLIEVSLGVAELPEEEAARQAPASKPADVRGGNRLGLLTQDLSPEQRKQLKLERGASIRRASGAAARADLRQGDVVVAIVSRGQVQDVRNAEHFNRLVDAQQAGAAVSLQVRRGDTLSFVGLRIAARSP